MVEDQLNRRWGKWYDESIDSNLGQQVWLASNPLLHRQWFFPVLHLHLNRALFRCCKYGWTEYWNCLINLGPQSFHGRNDGKDHVGSKPLTIPSTRNVIHHRVHHPCQSIRNLSGRQSTGDRCCANRWTDSYLPCSFSLVTNATNLHYLLKFHQVRRQSHETRRTRLELRFLLLHDPHLLDHRHLQLLHRRHRLRVWTLDSWFLCKSC